MHGESGSGVPPDGLQGGSGVSPDETGEGRIRRDGESTFAFLPLDADIPIIKRQGYFLPHWTREGAIYHVVFRLRDSLPYEVLANFQAELATLEARVALGMASAEEAGRLAYLVSTRVEEYLDAGHGRCLMKDPKIASVVADALKHFDGQRYVLHAWCVMPNHVHAVVEPISPHELPGITHSWKSFTAHVMNKILQQRGEVWQKESYDHLIRNEAAFHQVVGYVLENPMRAGLMNWTWIGCASPMPEPE